MASLADITSTTDLKKLSVKELSLIASELRNEIIATTTKNGGHLSSNLGVVELTLALHYVFDLPADKLIFDVGHQCYVHKLLSDRRDRFSTIRQEDGLSGFPDRNESVYDPFTTGHAGTSISAGLGLCTARDKLNENYTVINVVGDASLVNGLNLEALTSSNVKPKNLIVILNDNGMSISKNRNGLYKFISATTTKKGYVKSKTAVRKILGKWLSVPLMRFRDFIKRIFNKNSFFEKFGFKYVGVVDGNNIKQTVKILRNIKLVAKRKAVFLHVSTTKGKGHEKSEERADLYHGVGKNLDCERKGFACVLGDTLCDMIKNDGRITAITAGMKTGTGLDIVEKAFPDNFVDVGIAEEYAVTLAAGMAAGGLKPIVAIYSTFLQRAYDQLLHDVCLQNLPVVFCIDRAGFVGDDGATHQGLFDLSYLSHLPNMTILAPNDNKELADALQYATSLNSPVAIRYPKVISCGTQQLAGIKDEPWLPFKEGDKAAIVAVGGRMKELALAVAAKKSGVAVISARQVKPLCKKAIDKIKAPVIVTLEENSTLGGFGSAVAAYLAEKGEKKVISLGANDGFVKHGSVARQFKDNGLSVENIISVLENNGI